jgi:hypothetical protein
MVDGTTNFCISLAMKRVVAFVILETLWRRTCVSKLLENGLNVVVHLVFSNMNMGELAL